MTDKYNKLVRDNIPQIIRHQGYTPIIRSLDSDEYFEALNQKLSEELAEYLDNYHIEELADIIEVVYAIVRHKGLSIDEFENIRGKKLYERGGFNDKLYLVEVERKATV